MAVADPIARLVRELARLPGIGEKTAQRLAFHVLAAGPAYAEALAAAVTGRGARRALLLHLPDPHRPGSLRHLRRRPRATRGCSASWRGSPTCVAIERTHEFRGRYHVLHGALSPLDGVGPSDLKIRELLHPARDRAGRRDRHRHQPRRGGGGDRPLPGPPPEADGDEGDPHRPGRSHGRQTWSTPTRSPWPAPWPDGASCDRATHLERRYRTTPLIGPGIPAIADGYGLSTRRRGA